MREKELARLVALAREVVSTTYPEMNKTRPHHYQGIVMILVDELTSYDLNGMSDEHIKGSMQIDLEEIKKSLNR
ncbi:hypothetical protein [Bacillus paranthracis]|uniref:hypothetical protein n=1 Tax=Bacillus paranthracis TaxID=2026186 RepID=UPI0021D2A69B|nr:hypothetical protein [Bacillus paranthracis]MCU5469857.1 hypothetical protein [Bacillus paranthracis]